MSTAIGSKTLVITGAASGFGLESLRGLVRVAATTL